MSTTSASIYNDVINGSYLLSMFRDCAMPTIKNKAENVKCKLLMYVWQVMTWVTFAWTVQPDLREMVSHVQMLTRYGKKITLCIICHFPPLKCIFVAYSTVTGHLAFLLFCFQCAVYDPCFQSRCLNTVPGYQCKACPRGYKGNLANNHFFQKSVDYSTTQYFLSEVIFGEINR